MDGLIYNYDVVYSMDFFVTISATRLIRKNCSDDEQICKNGTPLRKNTPIKHSTFRTKINLQSKQAAIYCNEFSLLISQLLYMFSRIL